MSKVVLLFVCAVIALSASCSIAQNMLTDPSFESIPPGTVLSDGVHIMDYWRFFSVNGAGGTMEAITPGLSGQTAIKLSRTSTSGDTGIDLGSTSLMVPALPDRHYKGTVWARSEKGNMIMLSIAAHTASGSWTRVQQNINSYLSYGYSQTSADILTPPDTGLLNFALRANYVGSLIVDNCTLEDITLEQPPTITYPNNEQVDSLSPTIGFKALPHYAYQIRIKDDSGTVWDSDVIGSYASSHKCPITLEQGENYTVCVRVRTPSAWTVFSADTPFTTPAAPIVKITSPLEADALRGPELTLKWRAESSSGITSQSISIDGGAPVSVGADVRSYQMTGLSQGVHTVSVTATSPEGTVTDKTRFYVRITPAAQGTLYVYDLTYANSLSKTLHYDVIYAISALQGLVNREKPRLFVRYLSQDDTWLNNLRTSGSWLSEMDIVHIPTGLSNLTTLFEMFRDDYKGVVLWDPNVNSTANVAGTVAGADDLIPIRYDASSGSIYSRLVTSGPQLPVIVNLRNRFTGSGTIWQTSLPSTGSKKNDAYIWTRENYLKTGKCNPNLLMYSIDGYWLQTPISTYGHQLMNRDYIIQNRGFIFDLSPWGDETPIDDPYQTLGLDLNTKLSIFDFCARNADGMIHMVGFAPWPAKYTNATNWGGAGGSHGAVETEWETTRLCSYYNIYKDADVYAPADVGNVSIYSLFPMPDRLTQNPIQSVTDLRKLGYLDKNLVVSPYNYFNPYIGDYDAGSWTTYAAINY